MLSKVLWKVVALDSVVHLLDALTHPRSFAERNEVSLKVCMQLHRAVASNFQPPLGTEDVRLWKDSWVMEDIVGRQAN